jgi:hypothetical protein
MCAQLYSLAETPANPPTLSPAFGLIYEVSQGRLHLFVTPLTTLQKRLTSVDQSIYLHLPNFLTLPNTSECVCVRWKQWARAVLLCRLYAKGWGGRRKKSGCQFHAAWATANGAAIPSLFCSTFQLVSDWSHGLLTWLRQLR